MSSAPIVIVGGIGLIRVNSSDGTREAWGNMNIRISESTRRYTNTSKGAFYERTEQQEPIASGYHIREQGDEDKVAVC